MLTCRAGVPGVSEDPLGSLSVEALLVAGVLGVRGTPGNDGLDGRWECSSRNMSSRTSSSSSKPGMSSYKR